MLDAIDAEEKRLLALCKDLRDKRAEPDLEGLAREAFLALRQEKLAISPAPWFATSN